LKHEAAQNPIETLQNDYNRRRQALGFFRDSILNSKASVMAFGDKLDGFKKQFPDDAPKFDAQYQQMVTLLKLKGKKYEEAKSNLALFDGEINRARAIWEMAKAAAEMNKAAGVDTDAFFAQIQTETALDSVQKSLNVAFADLEMSLADETASEKPVKNVTPVIASVTPDQTALPPADPARALDLDIEVEAVRTKA
jgi:hypothetical protein